jgi:hypothetical protein
VAARTLADTGDVARFTDRNRYASWTGTAPIEASSGEIDDGERAVVDVGMSTWRLSSLVR